MELAPDLIKERLPSQRGTYVLVLQSLVSRGIDIGKKGQLFIHPGFYLYVGSAFGPGGLAARVVRHAACDKKRHWHIDYLRPHVALRVVCFSLSPERLEDIWSEQIQSWPEASIPMDGFGATDSQVGAHLFFLEEPPSLERLRALGGQKMMILTPDQMAIRA